MLPDSKERIIKKASRQNVYDSMEKKKGSGNNFLKVLKLDENARKRPGYKGGENAKI
jgi:hypothetical protein